MNRLEQRLNTQLRQLEDMLQAACAGGEGAPRDDHVGEMLIESLFLNWPKSSLEELRSILYRANSVLGTVRERGSELRVMVESQLKFINAMLRAKEFALYSASSPG